MVSQQRYLVTGVTGLLGTAVRAAAMERGLATIGLARRGAAGNAQLDLTRLQQIPALLDDLQPSCIIHLAAISRPAAVERDEVLAERLNVDATVAIADWCAARGSRLVFASTDWVFDGSRGPYDEGDQARPTTLYGQQKLAGEAACLAAGGAVARLGWILDDRPDADGDFIQSSLDRLRRGESVMAVHDEHRTPIARSAAASCILEVACSSYRGIVHIAGGEHLTPYALLRRRAQMLRLPEHLIQPISRSSLSPSGRPRDVRLQTARLRQLLLANKHRQSSVLEDVAS